MPHNVKLELTIGENSGKQTVEGTFEDAEWVTFADFVRYTNELLSIQIVRDGGPGRLNVSYQQGAGLSFTAETPPDEQILALLHRLRPFLLQDEPTNFNRVCGILSRRMTDKAFRGLIKELGALFSGRRDQELIQIRSNDAIINSEATLMLWLNAHEYHRDRGKQEELAKLHQILPLESSRAIFVMMLYQKVNAIFALANVVHRITSGEGKLIVHL